MEMNELELLIDKHGLSAVLKTLAEICYEKSEHIRANWSDSGLARDWERAGNAVLVTTTKSAVGNVSPGIRK